MTLHTDNKWNLQTNKLCFVEKGNSFQSFMMMKTRTLNVLPIVPLGGGGGVD